MSMLNVVPQHNHFDGININSTLDEKINAALNYILTHSGHKLDYSKLFIDTDKIIIFDKNLLETRFIEAFDAGKLSDNYFSINNLGKLMFAEHGSYLNYITLQNAVDKKQQQKIEEKQNEERIDKGLTRSLLWYNHQDAKFRFDNYLKVQKQRDGLFLISIVSIIVAIIALFLN